MDALDSRSRGGTRAFLFWDAVHPDRNVGAGEENESTREAPAPRPRAIAATIHDRTGRGVRSMAKSRTPRKAETPEKPGTRKRQNGPVPAPGPQSESLGSTAFHDQIAGRAYELFLARGCRHGDDWADWFRAEMEIRGKARRPDSSSSK